MARTQKIVLVLIPILALAGWLLAAQAADPAQAAKGQWLRLIQSEMDLVPRLARTFQPRPYQSVQVILGAGEFGMTTNESMNRRGVPGGTITNVRFDTSDPDFLIVSYGHLDNVGQWRHRVVHYIAWDKIVDFSFENTRP